jgi:hypothetical protein
VSSTTHLGRRGMMGLMRTTLPGCDRQQTCHVSPECGIRGNLRRCRRARHIRPHPSSDRRVALRGRLHQVTRVADSLSIRVGVSFAPPSLPLRVPVVYLPAFLCFGAAAHGVSEYLKKVVVGRSLGISLVLRTTLFFTFFFSLSFCTFFLHFLCFTLFLNE